MGQPSADDASDEGVAFDRALRARRSVSPAPEALRARIAAMLAVEARLVP